MKKYVLSLPLIALLAACGNDSDSNTIEPQERQVSFETDFIKLQFGFPSSSSLLDSKGFDPNDPTTYSNSAGGTACKPDGQSIEVDLKFVRVEQNIWDVFFYMDDSPLDIENTNSQSSLQNKASLVFDGQGSFLKQKPYIIKSAEIRTPEGSYQIEFDFYSQPSNVTDTPFNAQLIDANGC